MDSLEKRELIRLQPLQIQPSPVCHCVRRFKTTGALSQQTLTIFDLVKSFGIMAVTTTLGYPLAVAARLKRLRVWGFVATAGTPVNVVVTKAGIDASGNDFNDSFRTVQDSSVSFDRPAFVEMKLDKYTPSGSFHTNENVDGNLLYITCPNGAIIDLEFAYVLNNTTAAAAKTYTLIGAAVGTIYVGGILGGNVFCQGVNII
jgi:hypothetical protein